MRLSKPGLLSLSTSSSTIGALQSLHAPERASIITDFPLTPHLLLPEAFGDIYVGEEFSAYVSVVNGATSADAGYGAGDGYHSFAMSLHLLSPSATVELLDNRPAEGVVADPLGAHTTITPPLLAPGQRVDATVRTLLAELGMHTLRVTVLYRQAGQQGVLSEAKTMRKFYKVCELACDSSLVAAGRPAMQT